MRGLENLLTDARFGARMLRRAPLATAVALLTLTLGIGAFWGTRFAASAIEGLSDGGVSTVATAMVAMLVISALAAFIPARRATRVDPVIALRSE